MSDLNYDGYGEKLRDAVDSALRTGDFSGLGDLIGTAVSETAESVRTTVKEGIDQGLDSLHQSEDPYSNRQSSSDAGTADAGSSKAFDRQSFNGAGEGSRTGSKAGQSGYTGWSSQARSAAASPYYDRHPRGGAAAVIQIIFGIILFILSFPFIITFSLFSASAAVIIFSVLAAAGIITAAVGFRKRRFLNRYRDYTSFIRDQVYIKIEALAESTGLSKERVQSDLEKMIGKNMFRQAHLDTTNGCLILSDEAYSNYQAERQRYEDRKKAEEKRKDISRLTGEAKAVLESGEKYAQMIRQRRTLISDPAITGSIDKMDDMITRIFDELRSHPEVAGELTHMTEYYLPATVKLLDAYSELDDHPQAGENISGSKEEIETAVATLARAYEKLFDDLFRDRAWDISSDISVLNAMLAREGLTDDGLKA